MDISIFFWVQMNKILILFGLRARNMLPRRQNIEAERVIGKILGNKDSRSFFRAMDVVLEFGGKFAHMSYSLLFFARLSKGRSSQQTN
jgi:hypothetical protein